MVNKSISLHEIEESLRTVIQSLVEGQEGFQRLGDQVKDPALKKYFLEESLKRAQFRGELETVLHQEGVHDVKESGTVAGAIHRAWGDFKAAMGGNDHTLLVTAEQGEDGAKAAYDKALSKDLPLPIRQLLNTQSAHIQLSHDHIKAQRDRNK